MSLVIRELATVCHLRSPDRHGTVRAAVDLVDRASREYLPAGIIAALGPGLDRSDEIVRIGHITIKLRLQADGLTPAIIADRWALAFVRALFRALAYPDAEAPFPMRRFASRDVYLASYFEHLLSATGEAPWPWQELIDAGAADLPSSARLISRTEPAMIQPVLQELARRGTLQAWLSACDDRTLEDVVRTVTVSHARVDAIPLTPGIILLCARELVRDGVERRWRIDDRRKALWIWTRPGSAVSAYPPRLVHHAVIAIDRLLSESAEPSATVPDPVRAVVDDIRTQWREPASAPADAPVAAAIGRALRDISVARGDRHVSPAAAIVHSNWMGTLLLARVVERLDWWGTLVVRGPLRERGGARQFSYLLCSVAMAAIDPAGEDPRIDPAAALLAGVTGEIDCGGMRRWLESESAASFRAIGFTATEPSTAVAEAARALIATFGGTVRGLRHASPEFIAAQVLQVSGQAAVDEAGITVTLKSFPWAVAVRISDGHGSSQPPWLRPRALEIQLEDS
jgi:hypothetical protein